MVTFYFTNKIRITRTLTYSTALVLVFFLLTSCALKDSRVARGTFKKGKQAVYVIEKNPDDNYLSNKKLEHPYSFTQPAILNNLSHLRFKKLALFSSKEIIFDKKLTTKISPLFRQAFKKAGKNDIIEFNFSSSKGRISGDVFIFNKKLNWRFKIINGASYERRNSRDYLDSWKLALLKGQKYHGEKELFGIRASKNWIIYPVHKGKTNVKLNNTKTGKTTDSKASVPDDELLPDIPEPPSKETTEKKQNKTENDIEARFRRLKNLRHKGLITEEEYKEKKAELLKIYY